ncbi:hypothetical protein PTI98_004438 [Pleurotus ostreatus]|nr:hypothetical protein PTI98_004438 [Pleurotus ostreatus]
MHVLSSTASTVDPRVGSPIQEDSPPLSMATFRKTAEAGLEFLRANAGNMKSVTDSGIAFEENFTQLLILDVTKDRYMLSLKLYPLSFSPLAHSCPVYPRRHQAYLLV